MTRTHAHRAACGERGSVSVQMAMLMPLLFAIVFSGLQGGLFFYGRSAALSAATIGARAAAAEHGSIAACQRDAAAFIDSLGDVLTPARVECSRTATTVTVWVIGTTLSVIPGWHPTVEQVSIQPVERITR